MSKEFTGPLAWPIRADLPGHSFPGSDVSWNQEAKDRYFDAIRGEMDAKINALFEHYGIADKTDAWALVIQLAMQFVPGFKVVHSGPRADFFRSEYGASVDNFADVKRHRKGRPPNKTFANFTDFDLIKVVEMVKHDHKLNSDAAAARVIVELDMFVNIEGKGPHLFIPGKKRTTPEMKGRAQTIVRRIRKARERKRQWERLISDEAESPQ